MAKWRAAAALALCAALCCGLCGCGEETAFVVEVSAVPDTLDPQLADSDAEYIAAVNLFEGLFRLDADGTAQPAACERYTVSDDGLVWAFYLREDLYYNDGDADTPPTPVTADDFAFALQRLFAPGSRCAGRDIFLGIEGAPEVAGGLADLSALGVIAYTPQLLLIRLSAPDEQLPLKLCSPAAMPCNRAFYESTEGTYGLGGDMLLANGAFRLTLWDDTSGVTLRRVAPQEGLVNRVRMLPADPGAAQDAAARVAAGEMGGAFIEQEQGAFAVQTRALVFNCADAQLAAADVRAGLAGVARDTLQQAAGGLVPDSVHWGGTTWRAAAGDLAAAAAPQDAAAAYRQGLEQLQRSKLEGITVLVPDAEPWRALYQQLALAWQQQLSAYFSVQYVEEEELQRRLRAGDYQMALTTLPAAQDDVDAVLAALCGDGAQNYARFADPAVDALLAQARTADAAHRKTTLAAAELALLRQWPVVPLCAVRQSYLVAAGFGQVAVSPFGPLVDLAFATAA